MQYMYITIANVLLAQEVTEVNHASNNLIWISITVTSILITIVCFVTYMRTKKQLKNLKREFKTYRNRSHNQKQKQDHLIRENEDLKKKLETVEKHVKEEANKPQENSNTGKPKEVDTPLYPDEKPNVVEFKQISKEKIYLPSPFEELRFSVEDSKKERNETSLYVIELDSEENSGAIKILEDANFKVALNSPKKYLELVCIAENAHDIKANGIVNCKPGKVILEAQDWVVTDKIHIKYV
ncbi:hypothetical protein SAMN05216480_10680 [Pustulibacterium marinum]|uniref:Uncharacterized protein n=2 Tax=Pustulibacterium marinum TaxID=1224947 RepID=A0A1I7GXW5_9FLAO|nr:hypothetical protein SAMN05216480_10680 [Pustulibacterium marinum]